MKVLLVHYNPGEPGEAGGAEAAVRDQRLALELLGHEVHVEFQQPERAWDRLKPDIVHFHTVHIGFGLGIIQRAQRAGIPHVLSLHDYWLFCSSRMLLKTGTYAPASRAESCSAVTGICDGVCDGAATDEDVRELVASTPTVTFNPYTAEIFSRHGIEITRVIPHGIDTRFFAPDYASRPEEPTIVTVSAWPQLATKGMYVLREALNKVGRKARLVSGVPRAQVRDELQRANIMVFPSRYEETWGLCLTEAMACGCACIASDVCGARYQMQNGHNGVLFPNGDAEALAAQIEYLCGHPQQRDWLGLAARLWATENASLERMGRDYVRLYEEVIANGSS